jgi:iron complex transport system ATP-binding protein
LTDFRDRRLAELSDGERQKAAVARALAQEPALLLLDEPTAFLDALRREELLALLRRLVALKKWSCVVTTHEIDLALKFADDVWLLPIGGPIVVRKASSITQADVMALAFRRISG